MARLFTSGFEENSLTNGVEFTTITGSPTIASSGARTGTYTGAITSLTASTEKSFRYTFSSSDISSDIYVRTYLYITTYPNIDTALFAFRRADNNLSCGLNLTTTGALSLIDNNGSAIGTSSTLNKNQWYRIEHRAFNTNTIAELKIDGTTAVTSSSAIISSYSSYEWGGNLGGFAATTTINVNFDDIAINDTSGSNQTSYPGAGRVVVLRPNAAGDNNSFTVAVGGTAGAANNYTRVKEVTPDDATSYNGGVLNTDIDDFKMDATPGSIGSSDTITLVQINVRYNAAIAASEASFKTRIKKASGGTVASSAAITPTSTTWVTNANAIPALPPQTLYNNPDGAAWTKALLDTSQIGYNISTTNTNAANISAIWATVESVPAAVVVSMGSTLLMMGIG